MDRGAWQAIVHSATESDMTWQLSTRATHILESFFAGVGVNLLSINYRIEQRNNNIDWQSSFSLLEKAAKTKEGEPWGDKLEWEASVWIRSF